MHTVSRTTFTTVTTEGAILPADLLQRVAEGAGLEGLRPEDYHLLPNERLNEAINRSWNRCQSAWANFEQQRRRLPEADAGTTLTRERWLLILFQELGYGRLRFAGSLPLQADNAQSPTYPISHRWGHLPIHLVSFRQHLDRRWGGGRRSRSPHSLLQEFLNRSDEHLWGIVSNGLRLRVLRDNVSLTRAAYVEFDLETMMAGEQYADFALLWLVCHQSRVETPPSVPSVHGGETPEACWLERWSKTAAEQGVRALDALRNGVQEAIAAFGRGFLAHPANRDLKARLRSGELSAQDYYRQLLRLVYRLIFLFVAEDRELLLVRKRADDDRQRRERYDRYYSVRRLRDMAETLRGGPHADLYRSLRLLFALLRDGYPPLSLPALGSFLFSAQATPDLDGADLANNALLEGIRALAFTIEGSVRRPVDYRNLGAEELGSVYESLLELHPHINADTATFDLGVAAGSERKTTGSYYTPSSLIHCLLDSALEPVVEERLRQATADGGRQTTDGGQRTAEGGRRTADGGRQTTDGGQRSAVGGLSSAVNPQEAAILDIKVVDPACGSGHFLIAAAHRLARHLARARTGDEEPAPAELRAALRDVVRHCIHGVDINPMAVELCKVALWMETLDPGKPLSFLERNIQCGNSLIGATPALLEKGIPDEAFTPITGDDKAYCREYRKRNKQQRSGQLSLFAPDLQPWERLGNLAASMLHVDAIGDDTLDDVQRKQEMYESLVRSADYRYGQLWADAWCAAFVWKKTKAFPYPITEEVFRDIERNPFNVAPWMVEEIARLREEYQFFHWHLAFPHVFGAQTGDGGRQQESGLSSALSAQRSVSGFDVVLGNPPWERIKLQEKEFFAGRDPAIANARNAAARRKQIRALAKENAALYADFQVARRQAEGASHLIRDSGRYPLCGRGDVNTYTIFAELSRHLQHDTGRVGIIVPSGIATDDTTKYFFQELMETQTLSSLYDFENRRKLFPEVDSRMKFCLLTLTGAGSPAVRGATFVFFAQRAGDLDDPERRFTLSAADIALLNPNTRTCPIFRSRRDAELTKAIYRRVPVLVNEETEENPWGVSFLRMFDMSNDSHLFRTREDLAAADFALAGNRFVRGGEVYLPLYEAKMMHHFDHRWATYTGRTITDVTPAQKNDPAFVVQPRYWVPEAEVNHRLRNHPANWLTGFRNIARSTDERTAIFAVIPKVGVGHSAPIIFLQQATMFYKALLVDGFNSLAFDYTTRQKVGGTNLTYGYLKQLPVLPPEAYAQPCPWSSSVGGPSSSVGGPSSSVGSPVASPSSSAGSAVGGPSSSVGSPVASPSSSAGSAVASPSSPVLSAWLLPRVLELTYTAWDLQPFARDCGYDGPPFRWDEARRFLLRCELDAAYFHLYGITRDDVAYIMETFPIVRRKDIAAYGEYRTQRIILEIYDAMQRATESGRPYRTPLDPPPADPRVAHRSLGSTALDFGVGRE